MNELDKANVHALLVLLAAYAVSTYYQLLRSRVQKSGEAEGSLTDALLHALRLYQEGLEQLGLGTPEAEVIKGAIYAHLDPNWNKAAIKFTGGAGGGTLVLAVLNDEASAQKLLRGLWLARGILKKNLILYWDSLEEGVENAGVKVEAFHREGPYKIRVRELVWSPEEKRIKPLTERTMGVTTSQLQDLRRTMRIEEQGLVITLGDKFGRVYYNGEAITSQETMAKMCYALFELLAEQNTGRIELYALGDRLYASGKGIASTTLRKYLSNLQQRLQVLRVQQAVITITARQSFKIKLLQAL
ncbi:MAG: hypothetical protein ABDI20_08615 [Candidatus Bipolaricaulaceae bacterium]